MQLFKTLGRAIVSTLKYISTACGKCLAEGITRDLKIDLPDLWAFIAAHHARISPLVFYQALDQALDNHISAGYTISTSTSDQTNRWLTILVFNRIMASSLKPILPFTMYPLTPGDPHRFLVGPSQMPFDIHTSTLAEASPSFTVAFISSIKSPLALPNMTPEDFGALTKWLYTNVPPTFARATDLQRICELWVAACQLGLYLKANTLLRLGMELMTPADRICSMDTVRWVFAHTLASSPLRGFVIAILAQRSQPDFASPFRPGDMEIWKERNGFMLKLQHARKLLAFATRNTDGRVVVDFDRANKEGKGMGQGNLPMPEFLVWDERVWNAEGFVVPDRFFVFPGTVEYEEGLVEFLKRK
ncbi:hypothetical protein P171DRAFT_487077 [Karstenula rhodostoma CBS 690.94]|uniref:BTB domain-containing protein n=1 Tax=Karstenula rhodostoma CBS 690.94 TaxID=1392251 RepID=A0A9P4UBH1_9PLEO|nr:hypothetical protein P171DRAFT_487077 [Karstenula rhodostoma CBS 690.94]